MAPNDFVDKSIAGAAVVVFSKTYCPYCTRAKNDLKKIGITPFVVELDELDDGASIQQELLERTGQRTVPSVWVNGNFIGGSDDLVAGITVEIQCLPIPTHWS